MSDPQKRGTGRPRGRPLIKKDIPVGDPSDLARQKLSPEDAAFLKRTVSRMSPDSQRVIAALEEVKRVYVTCGRDELADKSFKAFMEEILALRNGVRDEGRFFFVTGESGAGKTHFVKRMLAQRSELASEYLPYGTLDPVAPVLLQGPISIKVLGQDILEGAGYVLERDIGEKMLWRTLPRQLHHRHVLLIHIDETQHMVRLTESDHDRKELAKAIKSLTANLGWPISFVVSGLPQTTELARLDEQIERRGRFLHLPDVRLPEERVLVENIIKELAFSLKLEVARLLRGDMPDRIAHAAHYRYGRITQVVVAAIHVAIQRADAELTRDHFARAYTLHSHSRDFQEMNPFLVQEWRRLPPGTFLIEPEEPNR